MLTTATQHVGGSAANFCRATEATVTAGRLDDGGRTCMINDPAAVPRVDSDSI